MQDCDADAGICRLPGVEAAETPAAESVEAELIYFGDPMCSWCWEISPQLRALRDWSLERKLPFRLVMGGLRAEGGDPWNDAFRGFLRHHWRDVAARTGQTFNEGLLAREHFDYDTEPACRAVVTARSLGVADELEFMYRVQHGFYVDNEDPKAPAFYPRICEELGLDPDAFLQRFESDELKRRTAEDFRQTRRSGVSSFPTILLWLPSGFVLIARGFARFEQMRDAVAGSTGEAGTKYREFKRLAVT